MGFALHVFQVQMLSLAREAAWVLLEGFTEVGYNQDPQGKHRKRQTSPNRNEDSSCKTGQACNNHQLEFFPIIP